VDLKRGPTLLCDEPRTPEELHARACLPVGPGARLNCRGGSHWSLFCPQGAQGGPTRPYSALKATMGSTRAALRAGR
jgi:hypothetical protein